MYYQCCGISFREKLSNENSWYRHTIGIKCESFSHFFAFMKLDLIHMWRENVKG